MNPWNRNGAAIAPAVSKTKPSSLVQEAYDAGQMHFGENYVQELAVKAQLLPKDIKWHFIGHLQSKKCKALATIPNLYMVHSIDSQRLATQLNNACESVGRNDKLKVLVQVNTSGEQSKFGCEPSQCVLLVHHVITTCPRLHFSGLMTIGRLEGEPKPDCFQLLAKLRDDCIAQCALDSSHQQSSLELSMGMSSDYNLAVQYGATIVRLGSTIFGKRDYTKQVEEEVQQTNIAQ